MNPTSRKGFASVKWFRSRLSFEKLNRGAFVSYTYTMNQFETANILDCACLWQNFALASKVDSDLSRTGSIHDGGIFPCMTKRGLFIAEFECCHDAAGKSNFQPD